MSNHPDEKFCRHGHSELVPCDHCDMELYALVDTQEQTIQELREALECLAREVNANLGSFEYHIREAIGNTNYACLEDRAIRAMALSENLGDDHE